MVFSVLILPFLLFFFLPLHSFWIGKCLALVVVALSLTDYFDGYYARKYKQETNLGEILDPLADKCFVGSALITLVALQEIHFFWVILLIMREFVLMGVRHLAHFYNFSVPVSRLGKWKAASQYAYLTFVVGAPWVLTESLSLETLKTVLLASMIILSLFSGFLYCISFASQWRTAVLQKRN